MVGAEVGILPGKVRDLQSVVIVGEVLPVLAGVASRRPAEAVTIGTGITPAELGLEVAGKATAAVVISEKCT